MLCNLRQNGLLILNSLCLCYGYANRGQRHMTEHFFLEIRTDQIILFKLLKLIHDYTLDLRKINQINNYYVVPISRACTAIYLGGNVAIHGLITHCTLINFRKCGLHVFYLDHFL